MAACLAVTVDDDAMRQVEAFVADFAVMHGICNDDEARLSIVFDELITNLLKYGYAAGTGPGTVEITLSRDGDCLAVELVDDARAFDPDTAPAPEFDQPAGARPAGGLGLYIVRSLTEGMRYRRVDDRNVTQLMFRLESTPKQ
jgi:serine/threonine-protein kinase RsbW